MAPHNHQQTVDGDHGRIETREVWTTEQLDWLKPMKDWPGLRSIIVVESKREVALPRYAGHRSFP